MKVKERLSDAEADVMRVLWETCEPLRASEIVKRLSGTRNRTRQTVHVLLSRLEAKGFVSADRSRYFHKFYPAVSENEYLASNSSSLVKKVGGSVHSMIASLIEADEISDEDILSLSEMLNEKRREIEKKKEGNK